MKPVIFVVTFQRLSFWFERQIRRVGRHNAVARSQINNLVTQLLLFAVGANLLHQPTNATRGPQSRQKIIGLLSQWKTKIVVEESLRCAAPARQLQPDRIQIARISITTDQGNLRTSEYVRQGARIDQIRFDASHVEFQIGQHRIIDLREEV